MKTNRLCRRRTRCGTFTMLLLIGGAMHLASLGSRPAGAQETAPAEQGPQMVPVPRSYRGMYVDRNNNVRLCDSKQPLTPQEATASLLQDGSTYNEIRHAAEAMRKRVQEINSDIRGYRIAEKRAQEHQIAVQRTMRINEVYRRLPSGSDADRTERTEQVDGQYRRSTQTARLSAEEEERSLGNKPINHFVGPSGARLMVPAHRYTVENYNAKLAKEGLSKAEARLEKVREEIERLVTMREQLLPHIKQLDGKLRSRRNLETSSVQAMTERIETRPDAHERQFSTPVCGRTAGRF